MTPATVVSRDKQRVLIRECFINGVGKALSQVLLTFLNKIILKNENTEQSNILSFTGLKILIRHSFFSYPLSFARMPLPLPSIIRKYPSFQ